MHNIISININQTSDYIHLKINSEIIDDIYDDKIPQTDGIASHIIDAIMQYIYKASYYGKCQSIIINSMANPTRLNDDDILYVMINENEYNHTKIITYKLIREYDMNVWSFNGNVVAKEGCVNGSFVMLYKLGDIFIEDLTIKEEHDDLIMIMFCVFADGVHRHTKNNKDGILLENVRLSSNSLIDKDEAYNHVIDIINDVYRSIGQDTFTPVTNKLYTEAKTDW